MERAVEDLDRLESSVRSYSRLYQGVFQQARFNAFGLFRPPYGQVFDSIANVLKKWS